MLVPETYKCDVCGAERQTSNHWWMLVKVKPQLPGMNNFRPGFALFPWSDEFAFDGVIWKPRDVHAHLCGADCAHKKLNEFMSGATTCPDQKK